VECVSINANLISASGYQDHTAWPSASVSVVLRIKRLLPLRPPPPASYDRETPLFTRRDAQQDAGDLGAPQGGIFSREIRQAPTATELVRFPGAEIL
jgi:hypothetical protein